MRNTTFIYALFEGESVRYIGKANDPRRRFATHLRDSYASHKCTWVKGLLNKGTKPTMEIVDEVPISQWEFWEQHYMDLYRSWGFDLVNINDAGAGGSILSDAAKKKMSSRKGWKMTEEQRKKISDAKKGRKLSPEHAAAFASFWKGKNRTEEDISKKREAGKRRVINPESVAKMKATLTGRKLSEEHKIAIRKGGMGKKHTEETKAKMKGRIPTEEERIKMSDARKAWHAANKQKIEN